MPRRRGIGSFGGAFLSLVEGGPALITATETGTGTDAEFPYDYFVGTETGTGTDAIATAKDTTSPAVVGDTGVGTDAEKALTDTVTDAETGAGTDQEIPTSQDVLAESGTATEAQTITDTVTDSESGTGTETQAAWVSRELLITAGIMVTPLTITTNMRVD